MRRRERRSDVDMTYVKDVIVRCVTRSAVHLGADSSRPELCSIGLTQGVSV